jgi:hypothetical protein
MNVAEKHNILAGTEGYLRGALEALVGLQRRDSLEFRLSVHTALMSRGCVYHRSGWSTVRLGCRVITPDDSWRVVYTIVHETDSEETDPEWPPDECFPAKYHDSGKSFTQ